MPRYVITRYAHNCDLYYKVFSIPKSSGRSRRWICAPSRELKGLQRWIVRYVLNPIQLHDAATGYRRRLSIVDNAKCHVDREFVANVDIRDFFPSISTPRVFGMFRSLGYCDDVAWILSRLCTYRGRLPQGAPSSPGITNVICRRLDARLSAYCDLYDWSYSRYSDDITVSGDGPLGQALRIMTKIISAEGFAINPRKTRVSRRGASQQVTGLIVNAAVALPRNKRKLIRAMFYRAKIGHPDAPSDSALSGHLALLTMINPDDPAIEGYRQVLAARQSE